MALWEMSLTGGIFIAAVLVLRGLFLWRLPKWTFLLLWGAVLIRLLLPFRLPARCSVYTAAEALGRSWAEAASPVPPAPEGTPPAVPQPPAEPPVPPAQTPLPVSPPAQTPPAGETAPVPAMPARLSPVQRVWLAGGSLCALFFGAAYGRLRRRFRGAEPAKGDFIRRWRKSHGDIPVLCAAAATAPLAFGLLRPAILLPAGTDWEDGEQLTYVLTHEYVHIRRRDNTWKLLLALVLCLHWWNPLVWAMYAAANRDLELSCDEGVLGTLGADRRAAYARALLRAEEGRCQPLCSGFAKTALEERITAMMKQRPVTRRTQAGALALVLAAALLFATSAQPAWRAAAAGRQKPLSLSLSRGMPFPPPEPPDQPAEVPSQPDAPEPPPAPPVQPETPQEPDRPPATPAEREPDQAPVTPPASAYPVNSRGQTYGVWTEADGYEDVPDLIYVRWDRETEGYLSRAEAYPYGWPVETQKEMDRYLAWYHEATGRETGQTSTRIYGYILRDQEGEPIRAMCALYLLGARLEDEALLERIQAGDPPRPILYIGTAPAENIPHDRRIHWNGQFDESDRTLLDRWTENGDWLRNSRGMTYGHTGIAAIVGYKPDLTLVRASNGASGFALTDTLDTGGYPGPVNTLEEAQAHSEWQAAQPGRRWFPVYDQELTEVLGFFPVGSGGPSVNGRAAVLELAAADLRRVGWPEEEIPGILDRLAREQGWK